MNNRLQSKDVVVGVVYWMVDGSDYAKPDVRQLVQVVRIHTGQRGECVATFEDVLTGAYGVMNNSYLWFEAVDAEYFTREIRFAAEAIARQSERILVLQKFVTSEKFVTN